MKDFFEDNLSSMSFTFSVIVLLNAVLGYFLDYEVTENLFLITLAILIVVLWGSSYALSHVSFSSTKIYHSVNLVVQLISFYTIALYIGYVQPAFISIVSNGVIFVFLYFLNIKRQNREINRLASKINKQLASSK